MAYDEKIAERLSKVFNEHKDVKEKKMFICLSIFYSKIA